jgi:hypothetical protein
MKCKDIGWWVEGMCGRRIRSVIGERYYTGDWQQSGVKKINGKCFLPAAQFTTQDKLPAPVLVDRTELSNSLNE